MIILQDVEFENCVTSQYGLCNRETLLKRYVRIKFFQSEQKF